VHNEISITAQLRIQVFRGDAVSMGEWFPKFKRTMASVSLTVK